MDSLDRALWRAWDRMKERAAGDPRWEAARKMRGGRTTYQRPLRSWALAIRCDDRRIDGVVADIMKYRKGSGALFLDKEVVEILCAPVMIPWPGVSVQRAGEMLGVGKMTIYAWARDQHKRLRMDRYTRPWLRGKGWRAEAVGCETLVWTVRPIMPSGEVYSGPWREMKFHGAKYVPGDWEQVLMRTVLNYPEWPSWRWTCPQCARLVKKVFWPMPVWTVQAFLGMPEDAAAATTPRGQGFVCRRCAGLIYEERGKAVVRGVYRRISGGGRMGPVCGADQRGDAAGG